MYVLGVINDHGRGRPQKKEDVTLYVWMEHHNRKDSDIVSSALWHFINHGVLPGLLRDKKKLIIFSDSCYVQNKNINMLSMLFALRKQKQSGVHISYYFPIRGHSFLPAERVFGRIGQQLKKLDTVLMPEEYLAVLRNHGTIHTYGEDWEAFDYKNEVKRFTKTQRGFKISEAKELEISSDKLRFLSVCIVFIALSRCNRVFTRRLRLCHYHTVHRHEVRKGDREV